MIEFRQKILLYGCLLVFSSPVMAQNDNCYQSLIDEGMSLYEEQEFEAAINRLKAARGCWDRPRTDQLETYIEKVNTGYRTFLAAERDKARAAQLEAERAKAQTDLANQALAEQLAISEASSLTYLANLELEKGNDQDALALAYAAYQKSDTLPIVLRTFGEVLLRAGGTAIGQAADYPIESTHLAGQLVTVMGDQQNKLGVFDTSGQLITRLEGHTAPITSVLVQQSLALLASAAQDRSIRLWSIDEGTLLNKYEMEAPLAVLRAAPNSQYIAAGSLDGQVLILDPGGEKIREVHAHSAKITDIQFSPDSQQFACTAADGALAVFSIGGRLIGRQVAHASPVWAITGSNSGNDFYTYGADQKIKKWDWEGQLLHSFAVEHLIKALFVDEHIIVVTGAGTILYYQQDGALQQRIQVHDLPLNFASQTPGTSLICTGSADGKALLIDDSGKTVQSLEHNSSVVAGYLSPDGQSVLTLDGLGTATLWDRQGNILLSWSPPNGKVSQIRYSRNGRQIWLGTDRDKGLLMPNPLYYLAYLEANPPAPLPAEKQIQYGINKAIKQ